MTWLVVAGMLAAVAALLLWNGRSVTIIYPPAIGLLYRDGVFRRELPPGRHVIFDPLRRTRIVEVSSAEQPVQLGEITVLSKDQFSFRVGLAPIVRVADARLFIESQQGIEQHARGGWMPPGVSHPLLHPTVAASAMEAAAARTLAELLDDQGAMAAAVRQRLEGTLPGLTVADVLLTSINLPPETRRMFTDVERARMEAQASLERARGEQAALRVLANAARLVTDNPALANLRLLQAVESSKGATTIVIGNPAAPMPGLEAAASAQPGTAR